MKKQSGFTLIELMVVMAIIAILATAGLTVYSNYLKKARDSARAQIARELMTKVEELANGGLPPTPTELITFLKAENFAPVSGEGQDPTLLDLDPLDGAVQCYNPVSGLFDSFCVFTYGQAPDGTYFVSYPVEHSDNIDNMWAIDATGQYSTSTITTYISGNIIGTNAYFTTINKNNIYTTAWPNFDLLTLGTVYPISTISL